MTAQMNSWEGNQLRASQSFERVAGHLYDKVKSRGFLATLKKLFAKNGTMRLFTFDEVTTQVHIEGRREAGVQTVAIDKILGTMDKGRSRDFDIDFRPLREHNKERWLGVAAAWISGRRLGRVKLVQAGDVFFVTDGHHRISVAKAMGEQTVEADVVIVLGRGELSMPAPVAGQAATGRLVLRPALT